MEKNAIMIPHSMKNFNSHFRKRLRFALKNSGSKSALANNIGVRYATLLSWFKGSTPSIESYVKLEQFLTSTEEKKS